MKLKPIITEQPPLKVSRKAVPFMTVYSIEKRWRFIARYTDENGETINIISDVDRYQAIEKKYIEFISSVTQVGTLMFCVMVAEGEGVTGE
jgi:uncharacterized protein (DUF1684 family)